MSQETKNKNEQPKDEAVSEQVSEKELPVEEPKENAENAQEAKAEEAKKDERAACKGARRIPSSGSGIR